MGVTALHVLCSSREPVHSWLQSLRLFEAAPRLVDGNFGCQSCRDRVRTAREAVHQRGQRSDLQAAELLLCLVSAPLCSASGIGVCTETCYL